ncbi:NmrA family transcriptional regulator [Streptomyces subrutilus]|uniref:NmrA family transcriptional regulator n=1 Tax=Streptomyces subrutilus TaxID=36818 RepID=A0A5P2UYC0_9ACTN|nr:NAD(P)H-binding protein [Streptomyces subrutilus]QEU82494.1 NmrA family transcriptional regulator [Streptomyces subrutilus]GGZ81598.1 NmrA family transcriptional regulator [Streptomyces subrutilus]
MIVITAPTGRIGHQVLGTLIDSGRPLRVIARDPARLEPRTRERVDIVQGSHSDPEVLAEAFAGADSLLWLVPPDPRAESVQDHYLGFTRPACEALTACGVRRVVGITSLGRAYGGPAGLLTPAFAMDALIEETGVDYRALAMPFFMENLLHHVEALTSTGTFSTANTVDRPLATVATRDIAEVAARLLLDDSWSGRETVPVIGPDDLTPEEMAQVMSEVLERPVRARQVALEDYAATMARYGASGAWARGLADMAAAQNDGIYDAERKALAAPAPTGFRQWCRDVLKPAVPG